MAPETPDDILTAQREMGEHWPDPTDTEREEAMVAQDAMTQRELQKSREMLLDDDKALAYRLRVKGA